MTTASTRTPLWGNPVIVTTTPAPPVRSFASRVYRIFRGKPQYVYFVEVHCTEPVAAVYVDGQDTLQNDTGKWVFTSKKAMGEVDVLVRTRRTDVKVRSVKVLSSRLQGSDE